MEGLIIDLILKILITLIVALILHELTHLLVILYYKIPIKAIIMTKWTAIGFLVDNEKYMRDRKKLIFLHLLPLIWCLIIFINLNEPFLFIFPLVNIFGGIGDIYYFTKYITLPIDKRIEWANRSDEKIRKSIIWIKEM
jgi:hypothetical protein